MIMTKLRELTDKELNQITGGTIASPTQHLQSALSSHTNFIPTEPIIPGNPVIPGNPIQPSLFSLFKR